VLGQVLRPRRKADPPGGETVRQHRYSGPFPLSCATPDDDLDVACPQESGADEGLDLQYEVRAIGPSTVWWGESSLPVRLDASSYV
jgi:hypothetical protein